MDRRRLILLIIFIGVSIIIGYLLYRVFFAPEEETPSGQPSVSEVTPSTQFPTAGTGAIGEEDGLISDREGVISDGTGEAAPSVQPLVNQLMDDLTLGAQVNKQGQLQLYNEEDGRFYKLSADGTLQLLSNETFFSVQEVTWSPNNYEAILEYPDGSNIYYNFANQKQVTLPKHWEDFSFSVNGEKIAAKSMALSPENRWLITADPDGTNIDLIEPMGDNADKVTIDWSPNQQIIGFSQTGESIGSDRQEILLVGQNSENFPSLVVEGRGFESIWSPAGGKLVYNIYSSRSDYKPELWAVNATADTIGTNSRLLNVNTWVSKCAFANERIIYCGVPSAMQNGAGFAPQVLDTTPDIIYKIDISTGLRTPVSTDGNHTIESIYLNSEGTVLFFTDKNIDGIFQVDI